MPAEQLASLADETVPNLVSPDSATAVGVLGSEVVSDIVQEVDRIGVDSVTFPATVTAPPGMNVILDVAAASAAANALIAKAAAQIAEIVRGCVMGAPFVRARRSSPAATRYTHL